MHLYLSIQVIPSADAVNATVNVDYAKQGSCNSSILVRVGKWNESNLFVLIECFLIGDYCDYVVTITIPYSGGPSVSTDLSVEIIMPDNDTAVMQVSKPQITYVGSNFANTPSIYAPSITMTSGTNTSQVLFEIRFE